jgi:hypothetical protein
MKLELKAFTWPTIFTSTNSFYPVFYHLQSCINRETALECRYMNVMTIVSVCGSLRGAKGGCSALFIAPKVISWVHMAHYTNEPYGPL